MVYYNLFFGIKVSFLIKNARNCSFLFKQLFIIIMTGGGLKGEENKNLLMWQHHHV